LSPTADQATLAEHGLRLTRHGRFWLLLDPDDAPLMIGEHGCCAPARREAIAEGLSRIARGDDPADHSGRPDRDHAMNTDGPAQR
jgi:hypothetical protein